MSFFWRGYRVGGAVKNKGSSNCQHCAAAIKNCFRFYEKDILVVCFFELLCFFNLSCHSFFIFSSIFAFFFWFSFLFLFFVKNKKKSLTELCSHATSKHSIFMAWPWTKPCVTFSNILSCMASRSKFFV